MAGTTKKTKTKSGAVPKAIAKAAASMTNDQIRSAILSTLYDRNANARSQYSPTTGAAVTISTLRALLKDSHGLKPAQVIANLNYLIDMKWVAEVEQEKQVRTRSGMVVPSTKTFYKITAMGIDRVEGKSAFTMSKFEGIKIEATGQNIITVGDGNQVNVAFRNLSEHLVELKNSVLSLPEEHEEEKLGMVADIDAIQSQLVKPKPNGGVVRSLWQSVQDAATGTGLVANVGAIASLVAQHFPG